MFRSFLSKSPPFNALKTTFEYNKMTVQKRYYHCLILGTFLQSQYFNILNINIITSIFSYSEEIVKYVPVMVKLCYAIAGVVAIIGAISVYIAMNNEEQDVKKKIMMVVGACLFLIAAAQALPLFFGINA